MTSEVIRRPKLMRTILLVIACSGVPTVAASQELDMECADAAPAVEQRGLQLFTDFCSRCHRAEELAKRIRTAPDPAAAASSMVAFLARHGSCDPTADEAIVRYLSTFEP